jgi:ribonuclease HI
MVRIYDFNINLVKIKMHGDSNNNKKVDKLAKLGMKKETLIIEDILLLHNDTIYW